MTRGRSACVAATGPAVGAAALISCRISGVDPPRRALQRGGEEDAKPPQPRALSGRGRERGAGWRTSCWRRVAGLVAEERVEAASFSDLYADADPSRAPSTRRSARPAAAAAPSTGWAAAAAGLRRRSGPRRRDWAAAEPAEVDDRAPTRRGPRRRRRARGRRRRGPRALRRCAGLTPSCPACLGDRAPGGPPNGGPRAATTG